MPPLDRRSVLQASLAAPALLATAAPPLGPGACRGEQSVGGEAPGPGAPAGGAAPPPAYAAAVGAAGTTARGARYCAFTESFQSWSIPEVCRRFREIGLDGLDLTVRPGGHIAPEDAPRRLPEAARAARGEGLEVMMLSTAIVDADAVSTALLEAAAAEGIGRVKLGYYRYQEFGTLRAQIDAIRRRLEPVIALAARCGVLPCVHIHSGDCIPSGGAAAYLLLKDFAPQSIGAYVDPMHLTIEGGGDGWRQGLDLLRPWLAMSSLKNFRWQPAARDDRGQARWEVRKTPLADGQAPIPAYLAALDALGFAGFFTLHSEYVDGGSWRQLTVEECLQQTRADLQYARRLQGG